MDRKSWMKILSGCSMASLILAGCGGGGGGGGGAAPIKTAAQAQQAAVSTTLVMGDGLSSLVAPPGGGSLSKKFAARIASENLPTIDSYMAVQQLRAAATKAMTVKKAGVTPLSCSQGSGTFEFTETATGFKDKTTYNNCVQSGTRQNGVYSYEEIVSGNKTRYIWIEGNGDQDVNDPDDYVFEMLDAAGTVVTSYKSSGTDDSTDVLVSENATTIVSTTSGSYKAKTTITAAEGSFSLAANMSGNGNLTETYTDAATLSGWTGSDEEFVMNGTMALSGSFAGENFGLTFTAKNLKSRDIYSSTLNGETGTWEANGSFSTAMSPGNCVDGAFTIKTLVPIRFEDDFSTFQSKTIEGEVELNGASRVVMSNNGTDNIVTIFLGTTQVFTGTEADLLAQTMEDCPLFGLAGGI